MKRAVQYSYTFLPSSNSLDLSAIPNFDINKLYAVLDLTSSAAGVGIIYAAGQQGLGYTSLSAGVMILQASMYGCTPEDTLMIIYDDGDQATTVASEYVQLVTNNAVVSSSNELPVTIKAQTSGLAQDTTVNSVVTGLGTIGSGPPTLPGTATGVMGLLRLIAAGNLTQGIAAAGAAVSGNPVLIAGSDGTDVRTALSDTSGARVTTTSLLSSLDITTALAVKATPGYISKIVVITAGSGAGSVNDCASTGSVSNPGNQIFSIPNTAGVYALDWPCANGICVSPGSGGQVVAVSYR